MTVTTAPTMTRRRLLPWGALGVAAATTTGLIDCITPAFA